MRDTSCPELPQRGQRPVSLSQIVKAQQSLSLRSADRPARIPEVHAKRGVRSPERTPAHGLPTRHLPKKSGMYAVTATLDLKWLCPRDGLHVTSTITDYRNTLI